MPLARLRAGAAPTRDRPRLAAMAALVVVVVALGLGPMPVTRAHAVTQTEVILDGKGFGHGVGMAQDGAYALGVAGKSTEEILATFYPGTSLGEAGGTVAVSLDSPQPTVELAFPDGGVLEASGESRGFPVAVAAGGSVRLSTGGGLYHAEPLAGATPAPTTPPPTTPPPTTAPVALPGDTTTIPPPTVPPPPPPPSEPTSTGPLEAVPPGGSVVAVASTGRRYRGVIHASNSGGALQLVNEIDVEEYLRGMGEIREPGWPAASLQTQAIAARTYALRSRGATLCSTDQCQVYLGQTAEYGAMDAAVNATRGVVVRYRGGLADAVYSANGGGFTATSEEGFGGGPSDTPYLQAVQYPTLDPEPWNMRSTLAEMAGRFGYGGTATGAHVSRAGPSGRALDITFDGSSGPLVVDGQRFETVLKLRSTLFTLRIEEPPPPPLDPVKDGTTSAGEQVRIASPPKIVALGGREQALNRRPWIALALLLLVGSASAANRVRAAAAPATGLVR